MKYGIFTFLLSFTLLNNTALLAQDFVEINGGGGHVVRNHPDFPDEQDAAFLTSVRYFRHLNGFKPWHSFYRHPLLGLDLTAGSMGNHAVLGYYAGAMGSLSFEKPWTQKWSRMIKLSLGATWFSNPHDEFSNPENVAIGSKIAFLTSAELAAGYQISSNWMLKGGVTILHASNSHFKLPNVGMNLPAILIGVRYKINAPAPIQSDTTAIKVSGKIRWNLRLALGMNESGSSTSPVNGPKYPIYLASVAISKMYSPINKVSVGLEAWYNKGVYDFIVSQEFYDDDRHKKAMAACVTLGHEFLFGKFGILTTGGIYFYNPFYKDRLEADGKAGIKDQLKSYIPARLGVQYHLKNTHYNDKNNLFFGLYIKSNFGQADFLESGFGMTF